MTILDSRDIVVNGMMKENPPIIAIYDLDFTLLEGDSEALWSQYLFKKGLVGREYISRIEDYYQDYEQGRLDIIEYEEFLLTPLIDYPVNRLLQLRIEYLEQIRTLIRPAMLELINWQRTQGVTLLLITASNSFLAEPIAALLKFPHLLCTQVEQNGNSITGKLAGIPAFRSGKVQLLERWLSDHEQSLKGSYGYSDSYNDLPLLELVDHPVAVYPDPLLRAHAQKNGWKMISAPFHQIDQPPPAPAQAA
jgi:HAD superfamily hydrolase (TIGR01490 family)